MTKDCSAGDVRTTQLRIVESCNRFLDYLQLLPIYEESPKSRGFIQLELREDVGVLHVLSESS